MYIHLFHLLASKFDFGLSTYSLFGNYFDYSHVATFYKLSMKSGLFSQVSTCLLFKLNLIGSMTCRVWFLEVINITGGLV